MEKPLILVVGAGPTGMSAAIELKRAGLDVRIVDIAERLAQHSQALVVQARTLEQFQRYGIAERAVARGQKLKGAAFWSDRKRILSIDFDRIMSRYPYVLMLPQNETEAILNECMESLGVKTERGVELVTLEQQDGKISVTLGHRDGSEEEIRPRWVIGCDGAHSTIREELGIPFEGHGVGISFFLGDLEVDGPDVPQDGLSIHFHHGGDVVFLAPLTEKLTRVIVALHSKQGEQLQRELVLKDFEEALDNAGIKVRVHSAEWMTPFNVHDLQARHYRRGNVFLAGDASHIHSPVGGQGMNTGVQDSANLCWKLAAVARGGDPILLDSYEEERGAVGRALLRFTERGLKLATATNPILEAVRDDLMPVLSSLTPVQRAMLGFISETGIHYRSSSIVKDFGGDGYLMAGDRMPDLGFKHSEATLLQDWTGGEHLAVLLDPVAPEVAEIKAGLPLAKVITVYVRDLSEEGLRALGTEKKLLIVRPDGYIGFRGIVEPHIPWTECAEQDALAPSMKMAF
jgi:2-polyprenyl-6-methoxyphenol hydroxylase-like FAD-dependent oxidoreductase